MKSYNTFLILAILLIAGNGQAGHGAPQFSQNGSLSAPSFFEGAPRTVISGSYRKHLGVLMRLKEFLQNEGIIVLAPVGGKANNPGEEFILLDADPFSDKRILQDSIFAKIRAESFHIIANVDGYIGTAAMMELGYAIACGLQILSLEPVRDPNLLPYTRSITEVFPHLDVSKIVHDCD